MASATYTFLNMPKMTRAMPFQNMLGSALLVNLTCGMNSGARTMGPATSWGKKLTNSAN